MNLEYPNGANFDGNGIPLGLTGAAINIGFDNYGTGIVNRVNASLTDTVLFHVFTNNTGFGFKFQAGGGRNVTYGSKFIGNYVGVYMYGHGMKFLGDTINGGTYGLVCDGGADPKIFEVPFFGCLSILSMNTSGSYKGGTFYIFDGEGNFGPPPGIGIPPASTGFYTLTAAGGGPTTGNTHYLIIDGYQVACPETTGTINAQTLLLDIGFVNTFFSNPANFPTNPGDFEEVVATSDSGNLNHVVITATQLGYSGNDIKLAFTSSATVTVGHSGNKLSLARLADRRVPWRPIRHGILPHSQCRLLSYGFGANRWMRRWLPHRWGPCPVQHHRELGEGRYRDRGPGYDGAWVC